jgi:hypothetical protein
LAAENDGEVGWDFPSRQPSQLSEIINSREINEQVGQDEVTGGTETVGDGEDFVMILMVMHVAKQTNYQIIVMT